MEIVHSVEHVLQEFLSSKLNTCPCNRDLGYHAFLLRANGEAKMELTASRYCHSTY